MTSSYFHEFYLRQPYLQIRSHSDVLRVRILTHHLGKGYNSEKLRFALSVLVSMWQRWGKGSPEIPSRQTQKIAEPCPRSSVLRDDVALQKRLWKSS